MELIMWRMSFNIHLNLISKTLIIFIFISNFYYLFLLNFLRAMLSEVEWCVEISVYSFFVCVVLELFPLYFGVMIACVCLVMREDVTIIYTKWVREWMCDWLSSCVTARVLLSLECMRSFLQDSYVIVNKKKVQES